MYRRDQHGVALVEIVIAMVIISVVVMSLFAALATSSKASKTHRNFVTADAVLRDYAEAAKSAARSCTAGATFTVPQPSPIPTGYTPSQSPSGALTCPAVTTTADVTLTVTFNGSTTRSLIVKVRTP